MKYYPLEYAADQFLAFVMLAIDPIIPSSGDSDASKRSTRLGSHMIPHHGYQILPCDWAGLHHSINYFRPYLVEIGPLRTMRQIIGAVSSHFESPISFLESDGICLAYFPDDLSEVTRRVVISTIAYCWIVVTSTFGCGRIRSVCVERLADANSLKDIIPADKLYTGSRSHICIQLD